MSALSFLNNLIPWWSFTLRLMIGVHWRYFGYRNGGEVRKPSMSLAVLCLQRRREDHKMILQHAGGVHMSHSGARPLLAPRKLTVWLGERALWECLVYLGVFTVFDQVSHRLHVPVQDQRSRKTTILSEMRSASWPNFSLAFITHNLCCMINSMLIFYINFV